MLKTLFTGIQPTGDLHIGNYFGAVKNWVALQNKYHSYICVVDMHALVIDYNPKKMSQCVFNMVVGLYACGIDMENTTLFVQSEVPGHADLTWVFNTLTPLGELERMTQFKEKAKQNIRNVNVGLLDYPVLQAADILLYKAEVVPVGEDQVQHIELTREIARYFNRRFSHTFPECKAHLTNTPRIIGLDGDNKMSKSKNNTIGLLEKEDEIWAKLSVAKTDPARKRRTDKGTPEICNLYSYHKLFTPPEEQKEIAEGCRSAGIGCIDCKKKLLNNIIQTLKPIQDKYQKLTSSPAKIHSILEENTKKCRYVAKNTILEVKEKIGLKPVWKI